MYLSNNVTIVLHSHSLSNCLDINNCRIKKQLVKFMREEETLKLLSTMIKEEFSMKLKLRDKMRMQ